MPAGVSWPRYLRMFTATIASMFLGAQAVHQYYLPDLVKSNNYSHETAITYLAIV
uniref:Uncharacterized protein n=1 Tax=Neogobius melanostomus TaxID=47308 RepID=A0A8C6TZW5_9GOBI